VKKVKKFYRTYEIIPEPKLCLLEQGLLCQGVATRGGCSAPCPQANMPCTGCYGPPEGVIDQGAKLVSAIASIIDPTVQISLPWDQTVNGAVDGLSHLMENYFVETDQEVSMAIGEALERTIILMADRLQKNPDEDQLALLMSKDYYSVEKDLLPLHAFRLLSSAGRLIIASVPHSLELRDSVAPMIFPELPVLEQDAPPAQLVRLTYLLPIIRCVCELRAICR
jgi:hypothetical protein